MEGEEVWDEVDVTSSGERERVFLRPDAFFSLKDTTLPGKQNKVHFLVFADYQARLDQFEQNLLAYWEYQTKGKYTKRYGVHSFRLLVFSATAERSAELAKLAHDKLPQKAQSHFLFAALPVASANILGNVFLRATGTDVRCALIPARKNSLKASV
jgi:hypothetical protein